jgi:hypothetical protein
MNIVKIAQSIGNSLAKMAAKVPAPGSIVTKKMKARENVLGNARASSRSTLGESFMAGARNKTDINYAAGADRHQQRLNYALKRGATGAKVDRLRGDLSSAKWNSRAHWAGKHWKGLAAAGVGAYALHRATKDDE